MPARGLDWDVGRYESTAERLLPAARVVVESAAPQADERVLDLGCGTGNAALLAAAHGGPMSPAWIRRPGSSTWPGAGRRAKARRSRSCRVRPPRCPLATPSADVILSVFAVIFAPDAVAAAAEMSRVVDGGRPDHPERVDTAGDDVRVHLASSEAFRQALGAPSPPQPFAWHDRDALSALLSPHGFTVEVEQHTLSITDTSPAAYLDAESRDHPMAVAGLAVLERLGQAEELRGRLLQILVAGNEDPAGFRTTSRYVVARARRATG